MVNYYDILKVSPKASKTEVKSAYRRLARKLHPDRNNGSEETALKFAAIAEAYEILGNPKERVKYDRKIVDAKYTNGNGNGFNDSFFTSGNPHAKRWRQMVYEKRYNDIIDRMIAEERSETMAFQKVVYPLVGLFVTAVLSTALKPRIFANSEVIGKIIIVSLFIVGVIHIIGRIRDGFERYTQPDDDIHESILDEQERKRKPYSSPAAGSLGNTGKGYFFGPRFIDMDLAMLKRIRIKESFNLEVRADATNIRVMSSVGDVTNEGAVADHR